MAENWYRETFNDCMRYELRTHGTPLFEGASPFQRVEILDTHLWGRVLVIDGVFQTSERDEAFYHEMLVHPALLSAPSIDRVLIIGGGDGGSARQVLRHAGVEQVVMVEIDGMVVEACQQHLPSLGAWDDPRLDLRIADGIAYVRDASDASFDIVLLDGVDPAQLGPGDGLFERSFYEQIQRVLTPRGVFALQSQSPILQPQSFARIQHTLRDLFAQVHPCFTPVPLYAAGIWSFTWASATGHPTQLNQARLQAMTGTSHVFTPEHLPSAYAQPAYVQSLLT